MPHTVKTGIEFSIELSERYFTYYWFYIESVNVGYIWLRPKLTLTSWAVLPESKNGSGKVGAESCWYGYWNNVNNLAPIFTQSVDPTAIYAPLCTDERYMPCCRVASPISPHCLAVKRPSYCGYLLIPGPGPAPLPPAGAPLLGLMSCPESGGAEMEAGAPAAGTAGPGCPGCPSPSILASFPIASG